MTFSFVGALEKRHIIRSFGLSTVLTVPIVSGIVGQEELTVPEAGWSFYFYLYPRRHCLKYFY